MSLPLADNMKQVILSSFQVDTLSWWLLPTGTWSQENTILTVPEVLEMLLFITMPKLSNQTCLRVVKAISWRSRLAWLLEAQTLTLNC